MTENTTPSRCPQGLKAIEIVDGSFHCCPKDKQYIHGNPKDPTRLFCCGNSEDSKVKGCTSGPTQAIPASPNWTTLNTALGDLNGNNYTSDPTNWTCNGIVLSNGESVQHGTVTQTRTNESYWCCPMGSTSGLLEGNVTCYIKDSYKNWNDAKEAFYLGPIVNEKTETSSADPSRCPTGRTLVTIKDGSSHCCPSEQPNAHGNPLDPTHIFCCGSDTDPSALGCTAGGTPAIAPNPNWTALQDTLGDLNGKNYTGESTNWTCAGVSIQGGAGSLEDGTVVQGAWKDKNGNTVNYCCEIDFKLSQPDPQTSDIPPACRSTNSLLPANEAFYLGPIINKNPEGQNEI